MRSLIDISMIAPCGMNCAICRAHLRQKNPCHGCHDAEQHKPKTRVLCPLRICDRRKGKYCFDCVDYPCDRLKRLDKRYRTQYGMSEIENLEYIRNHGITKFLEREQNRWIRNNNIFCVHDRKYYKLE